MQNYNFDPNDKRVDGSLLGNVRAAAQVLLTLTSSPTPPSREELLAAVNRICEASKSAPPAVGQGGLQWVEGLESLAAIGPIGDPNGSVREVPILKDARDAFERAYLRGVLRRTGGNVTAAAKVAGRNRTDFYELLHRRRVSPREFKGE